MANNDYGIRFSNAIDRAHRLNLAVPHVKLEDRRYLTNESMAMIPKQIHDRVGLLTAKQVVLQCFYVHQLIKAPLEDLFDTELYYTIGYVETCDRLIYSHDEAGLRELLKNGISNPSVNLHAWLTLPSMEIIDFSLSASYFHVNEGPQDSYGIIANHADELKGGMKYHPTLVGDDFLHKIGAMQLGLIL